MTPFCSIWISWPQEAQTLLTLLGCLSHWGRACWKRGEVWKPWGSGMERQDGADGSRRVLQRLSCPSLSHPPLVTQQAPHVGGNEPVFSCSRGSGDDCDAQGRAWASHSPLP